MTEPGESPHLPRHPMAMGPNTAPPPKPPGMSSTAVKLGAVGVLSLLVVGFCAAQNDYEEVSADCVDLSNVESDGSYTVVNDEYCDDDGGSGSGSGGHYHYYGSHGAYGWYYGGTRTGGRVWQGTTLKPSDAQINTRSGRVVQRGGFGFHSGGGG
ncbi:hypothetical protein [Microtetraspora sp. NBRC 16547]|uniref:hypothetical protein n=1 Tax=Microtetraspora sp. NBRC 16547 TaxID=3030993 RepID=UPI0024A2ABB9|nr:hypothetical protein [Microtetraspora sp. NBRC 16547]GLX00828.1 hypothetical protein Misp02_49140 [Microtetraspora sp. NBRC 16547]